MEAVSVWPSLILCLETACVWDEMSRVASIEGLSVQSRDSDGAPWWPTSVYILHHCVSTALVGYSANI